MKRTPRILIADDNPASADILRTRLSLHGYDLVSVADGQQALDAVHESAPDLVLLDVMMPKVDGIEVCRRLRADASVPFIPVIIISARTDSEDIVAGLEAGADEYLSKPVNQTALIARVKSMLRIKELHDQSVEQSNRLKIQALELEEWNRKLEERVSEQAAHIRRISHLERYFSPQIAELIITPGNEHLIRSHRKKITVLFCDLRNFTEFSSTAEPEEQVGILREYHQAVGRLVASYEATIERISGDGVMMFFNDPNPCLDPEVRAVRLAAAMRTAVGQLSEQWRRRGFELGFGVGIANGFATLGQVGFEGQFHYSATGTVCNLASRLCDLALDGQILLSQSVAVEVEPIVEVDELEPVTLKGFLKPVAALNVVRVLGDED